MTLILVHRIQAVMFALFGLGMLLAPGAMMEGFNVRESSVGEYILKGMSVIV